MGTCFGQLKSSKKRRKRHRVVKCDYQEQGGLLVILETTEGEQTLKKHLVYHGQYLKTLYRLEHSHYNKNDDKIELHFLVEEDDCLAQEMSNEEMFRPMEICNRICSFFKPRCYKHIRGGSHLPLETEVDWPEAKRDSPSPTDGHNVGNNDNDDVQLVTLDVLSLRNIQPPWRHASLTPPSSIDLEWESDGVVGNVMPQYQRRLLSTTEECSLGSVAEGSPAESLEWDSGEGALDTDTEQLLCEIERLTARALRETGGDWANR